MGPDWAPYGLAHFKISLHQPKYDIIVLIIAQLKRVFGYVFTHAAK